MKKIILFGFCVCVNICAFADTLIPLDSIGIEKVGDKTFIIHQVEERETLFAISRRYETSLNDILQNNEELKQGLKMGQRIRIPYITKAVLPEGAVLHKVAPGETLFSISKTYGVSVGEIMAWNKLQGNDLSVGKGLVIEGVAKPEPPVVVATETAPVVGEAKEKGKASKPVAEIPKPKEEAKPEVNRPATLPQPTNEPNVATNNTTYPGDWITHTVEQGETLFSVAQKYDAKVEDLITWNALSSNNLSLGQRLKVGRESSGPSKVPVVSSTVPVIINNERADASLTKPDGGEVSTAYKNIKETGLAEVIAGTGNHKKYLVLHRDAPVGTIMRVRNEENDVTIFARVVGKLPETGDNSRLVIKLSKAAFDQLRAVNARFPVEVSY